MTTTRHTIPIPFGPYLHALSYACGGNIPNRCTPAGLTLLGWSVDGVRDDERETFDLAAQHWSLWCGFTAFGDVVRQIARQAEINASRGA